MKSPQRLGHLVEVFQGNQPLVEGLVALFLDHTPQLLAELLMLVREGRINEFHGVAFRLKSNLRVLGFPEIRNEVEAIGVSLRAGKTASELEPALNALELSLLEACHQLSASH
jgi:HPt (histidine-containing phosphotransfer) domain-containing protein